MSFDGRWLVAIPLRALCTGAHGMAWLRQPTAVGDFTWWKPGQRLGEKKKIGQRLRRFASRKVLDKFSKTSLLNKPPPKLNFQKKCRKNHVISSFLYLPATFCQCFGLFVVWFPWVSPTFGDQIALPPTLKTANQKENMEENIGQKARGGEPRNVEMMIWDKKNDRYGRMSQEFSKWLGNGL